MDKKVGIVSCYFKKNYGSMLQAYATQKILDDWGIPNETIHLEKLNSEISKGKRKYYKSQLFNFSFIKAKFGMVKLKLYCKFANGELGKNIKIRNQKFKEFEKKFHLSKSYDKIETICQEGNYTDVLVGSDQLWLPVNIVADYYTLNFVPEEVNKISFATSFGVSSVPEKYKKQYQTFLNRIEHLSVREDKGVQLVKELTGREAELVCDPTLLFNQEEWREIQAEERLIKERYIFCYFLGKTVEYRKFAERLKEKTGFKIVSLNHLDEYVKYSDKFADEAPFDVGPSEFLNLIRNAEFVCTDSFHGTVFSLIHQKKFFVFRRYQNKSKVSTNSRLDSLLKIVNLSDRMLEGNEAVDELVEKEIDYDWVNEKLEKFREESKTFLRGALENGKN